MAPSFPPSRSHQRRAPAGPAGGSSASPAPITLTATLSPSATPTPSRSAPAGVSLPPRGAAAIVAIVVVLSFFVISFTACRIYLWRRGKKSPSSPRSNNPRERLWDASSASDTNSLRAAMSQTSSVLSIPYPADVKPAVTRDRFPAAFKVNLNYQPKIIYSGPQEEIKNNPLPSIAPTPSPPVLKIRPPPSYAEIPVSALSPRTVSKSPSTSPIPPSSKLPRLVLVDCTFSTTLHDELEICEGETLRLLEEYADQWCLVQRVGGLDAEKGVVPRFCVVDKPSIAPLRKSKHISRLTSIPKI